MFTKPHVANFSLSHLMARGWYLNWSSGFVPFEKRPLYIVIVSDDRDEIVHVELDTQDIKPPPLLFNENVSLMSKGKAMMSSKPSSTHKITRFATKAFAPYTFVVGRPSAFPSIAPYVASSLTPFIGSLGPASAPSQSNVSISHVLRKRKAVALDTSATSSGKPSTLSLIENVDMRELIEDLMKTKVPPLAYCRIQEFLTKFCIFLYFFSIQSIRFNIGFIIYISLKSRCAGWNGPYSTQRQAEHFLDVEAQ